MYVLELWRPTCAFKDMALQILPHLLTKSMSKVSGGKKAVILVATSGDTGKAALEGFRDVAGTEIMVFYPQDGVSPMQERQMNTQEGRQRPCMRDPGDFDDAQNRREKIFTDPACGQRAGGAQYDVLQRQLHQLGTAAAPDRLLFLRLL